jgi:hypothetical protein
VSCDSYGDLEAESRAEKNREVRMASTDVRTLAKTGTGIERGADVQRLQPRTIVETRVRAGSLLRQSRVTGGP